MRRGKLPLKLIAMERARRITFAKRKKGLLKKAYELSTLCDVKVCVVIYNPTNQLSDHDHQQPLETWPEQPQEVESIIAKYVAYKAKNTVSKKDLNLTDFFNEKIKRLQHETRKLNEENHKNMMILKSVHDHDNHDCGYLWDNRIDGFSLNQLHDLMVHLDKRISDSDKHLLDCYNKNMLIMCVTSHDNNNYYYDPYHYDHHMMKYGQFGSTSTVSPMKMIMMQDHQMASNSFQTSSDYDQYYHSGPQYSWHYIHDHPAGASSSKTESFDRHHLSSSSGSFTSMMLNSGYDQTGNNYNEDESQYYSNLMNVGSTMFNNVNNNISTSSSTGDVLYQSGVFLNNHAHDMVLQPYGSLFCDSSFDGSRYSSAMVPVNEQSLANQFRANSSQQDVKFCDNLLHGIGKGPA